MSGTTFQERLSVAVKLTIAGTEHDVPGGAVKSVEFDLEPHGFDGMIEFVLQDDLAHGGGFEDKLWQDFVSQAAIDVQVELRPVYDQAESRASPEPVVLTGLATRRSMIELHRRGAAERSLLARRYRLWFADPARHLWTQHFPSRLYTQSSLASLIREQLGDKIKIDFRWAELEETRPLLFLHLPVEHGASFHDFVLWLADRRGGLFTYDHAAAAYELRSAWKAGSEPLALFGDDIADIEIVVPPTPAHAVEVRNTYADDPKIELISHAHAAAGIRHDCLMRSSIAQDVDDRIAREKQRLTLPRREVELRFGRMPVVRLLPGDTVRLAAADRWCRRSALVGKTWRVRRVRIRGVAPAAPLDRDLQLSSTGYEVEMSARLVESDDERPCHPTFRSPFYPAHVEGKIVSEKGESGEKTYQVNRCETRSLDEYTVEVPAWDGQKVSVPFIPYMGSGNIYVPSYREERVLLALDLEHAWIERLLVWRDGAALSMDVQGQHILLGKSQTSNTSINHVYEDDKPVFNVARTSRADTGLLRLSEGTLLLRVEEKD